MSSDTPRTDAVYIRSGGADGYADLCRQLERELAAKSAEVERKQQTAEHWLEKAHELRQRVEELEALLREARDTAYASTVEQGISDDRRKYRIDLVQRIDRALEKP